MKASIVGSIGVIAEWFNYEELVRWAKLRAIVFKAGEFKDTGSPLRKMTPAEKVYFQGLIDNMHRQFIHSVAEGRHMPEDGIRAIANGKVWTGQQALGLKLIDQIGDFQTAVKETRRPLASRASLRLSAIANRGSTSSICCSATFPSICPTGRSCSRRTSASTICGNKLCPNLPRPVDWGLGLLAKTGAPAADKGENNVPT